MNDLIVCSVVPSRLAVRHAVDMIEHKMYMTLLSDDTPVAVVYTADWYDIIVQLLLAGF